MIDVDTGSFLLMVLAAMLSTLIFPFIGLALRRPASPGASFEAPALKPG